MDDEYSIVNIDSLLFQFALQTRELLQKKNEINQQITVCRADIAERRSYIETIQENIKKLEEEIKGKLNTVRHNKEYAKSMKAGNSLLLQYEQTLKAELESRKNSYKNDMDVYGERIGIYRKTFQSHKEYYCQNPLAQKLLTLQAQKEEIESRIKACDDQITIRQKELEYLTGLKIDSSSTEKQLDSVPVQQPIAGPEKQLDPQTEEETISSIDISSLHLNQTEVSQNGDNTVEANAEEIHEENKVQYATICSPSEEENNEQWPCDQLDEQTQLEEMHTEEQEAGQEDQVMQSTVSGVEEAAEDEVEESVTVDEGQAQSEGDNEGLDAFPQSSSQGPNSESSLAKMTAVPSTPTFPFTFSPASSPHQGPSDTKSPAFLFSLNSDPSTPGFSGFGFDVGSSQYEESSFAFTGSFFNEKKNTESKSSTCPEFLFGQPEQSEDFQFAFSSESPQTTNKDNTREDFPFSFNF